MGRLDDKVALITGGAKGQGAAEGTMFRAEGAQVWIADVDDAGPMSAAGSGTIVNISSAAGLVGMPNTIGHTATKWAVRGMTKSAPVEPGRYGVRVNSIHPGIIDTELLYENPVMRRDDMTAVLRTVPLRRMAQPEEVAAVALSLASDESGYCTGGEFTVDGGVTAS